MCQRSSSPNLPSLFFPPFVSTFSTTKMWKTAQQSLTQSTSRNLPRSTSHPSPITISTISPYFLLHSTQFIGSRFPASSFPESSLLRRLCGRRLDSRGGARRDGKRETVAGSLRRRRLGFPRISRANGVFCDSRGKWREVRHRRYDMQCAACYTVRRSATRFHWAASV